MSAAKTPDQPVVSDRLSRNAMRHVSERIIEGLLFAAAVGVVFGALLWVGAGPAMHAIGLEPALAEGSAAVASCPQPRARARASSFCSANSNGETQPSV